MYPKNKIAVLLLCFAMMLNIVGCGDKTQDTSSKDDGGKDVTSSLQSDTDSSKDDVSSEDDTVSDTQSSTPSYIYIEEEDDGYQTDRYISITSVFTVSR